MFRFPPAVHLISTGAALLALVASNPSQAPAAPAENSRTITASGNAAVQVVPDEVVITLGIETNDKDVQEARKANDSRLASLKEGVRKAGVAPEHMQTDYLSIEPRMDTYGGERRFLGFWCSRTLVVRLKDLSRFEQLLADSLDAGANYVHSIEFRTTELRRHRDRARQMAIQAARDKARALAAELGCTVGSPRTIGEGSSSVNMPSFWGGRRGGDSWMTQNSVQAASSASVPENTDSTLAPGQIQVTAQVSVTFDLDTTATAETTATAALTRP